MPGILPPVEIGGEHFIDGGIVNSIPIDRAVFLGAGEVYVLHAGRIEQPLDVPRSLRDVGMVAFASRAATQGPSRSLIIQGS